MELQLVAQCAVAVAVCVTVLWLISVRIQDVSIADIWWGPGFALIIWVACHHQDPNPLRFYLTAGVVAVWGVRLGSYLWRRNVGGPEDARYQAMRSKREGFWWTSMFTVFLLQGALQLLISLPLYAVAQFNNPWSWLDILGISLAASGVCIEAVSDAQLARFKSKPESKGRVMDQGLWGWSRHPNYFGNATLWAGLGCLGLAAGGPWWVLTGPAVMLFLLLRVSGVALLESTITERRPEYVDYIERVPGFFPRPPRSSS